MSDGRARRCARHRRAKKISPSPPPIALDATHSAGANLSGVGVYSREILYGLAALYPEQRFLWCYRSHRLLKSFRQPLPANCARRMLGESWIPRCGLFHGLGQRLPQRRARRNVVTFHDLFVMTGDYSTPEFRARFTAQARDAAARADLIIAVSEFTASKVEALLAAPRSRIHVVPHGAHLPDPPIDSALEREPMILHVGVIQKRKNVARLVEAFERTPAPWRLVLAGGQGFGAEAIMARIETSPARARIEVRGFVSQFELEQLYRRAAIFAFPSLDEGFGIPVLEAMAYRVPVVTSNGSALKEVGEDASLLVNPERVDEITAALTALIGNPRLRVQLAETGYARARQHSWSLAAERTFAAYGSV